MKKIWIAGILASVLCTAAGAEYRGKNASPVPRFTFGDTLEEQEQQLANNPLLEHFKKSRAKILKDPLHPRYHSTSPENRLNDPNGLSYWNGKWHLFYQGYPPEHPRQHWGHAISDDLIHWRDLSYAIYPGPERACFSGSVFIEEGERGYRLIGTKHVPAVVTIDSSRSTLAGDVQMGLPESAQVDMRTDEPLKLRVFIDRSIVEVFINGCQCITARVYPERGDSVGVSLRAQGNDAKLTSLDAWQMKSIYK